MTKTECQFFELLKSGIWNKPVKTKLFVESCDWNTIYSMAEKQSVSGVVFDGIEKLPKHLLPDMDLLMDWLGQTSFLETQNQEHNKKLVDIVDFLNNKGFASRLLKGQGCGTYYPNPLHRQCGDIDLFVGQKQFDGTISVLESIDIKIENIGKKDAHFTWSGIPVELHRFEGCMYWSLLDRKFQTICRNEEWKGNFCTKIDDKYIAVLNPTFNVFFVFVHLWHHFVQVGVGLRQICDWMLMLQKEEDHIDWSKLHRWLKDLGLLRSWRTFYALTESFMGQHLNYVPEWMQGANEKDVLIVLNDIMTVGNFGKHGESMKMRSFGGGIKSNFNSYCALLKRLCKVWRFGRREIIGYPLYKLTHGVRS